MATSRGGFVRDDVTGALVIQADQLTMNPGSGAFALDVNPSGAVSASTSTGGAINVTNTSSTGAGIVVYSNAGAGANGRLLVVRSDNAAYPTQPVYVENHGASHAMSISHCPTPATDGNPTNGNALSVTSRNPNDTSLGVNGEETGKGSIKVVHWKPDGLADTNASALSMFLDRRNAAETSAAQGIFLDSSHTTTGKLLNLRNNGADRMVLAADGKLAVAGTVGFNGTAAPASKATVSGAKGSNAALGSLLAALSAMGLITDSTTA